MDRCFTYQVLPEEQGMSVGEFLKHKEYSHHILVRLKNISESYRLNGEAVPHYIRLTAGDTLEVHMPEIETPSSILPVPLPLTIVYEDEDLFVFNKAADMPVHPSLGNHDNTLANGLAWMYQEQKEPFVFRCINRLDRDTTGLLIVARNPLSGARLSQQMKLRQIHRTYLALAEGCVPVEGTITSPIGRREGSVIERCVDPDGESAATHFQRLLYIEKESLPNPAGLSRDGLSLVQLKLETGRTHQIRVHLTSIGHPLPGDSLYNPASTIMKRQALHSWKLDFVHPFTGECLHFTAPLPEDMRAFIPHGFSEPQLHEGIC